MESNIEKQKNSIVAEIILNLLPIMDNFERALDCEVEKGSAFYEGTSMIYREFLNVLAKFGVTPIKAIGEPFDPLLHEAVAVQTVSDIDSDGKVVQEVQKGYTLKGEVIRPARVIVGKLNEETDKEVGNDE
jgi:molecular chaperone GrpE